MSEPQEHTPRPWRLDPTRADKVNGGETRGLYSEREWIGEIHASSRQENANAEFIVQACNSHDDLLAACKALMAAANELKDGEDGEHADDCIMCKAVTVADEVIANAEA